MTGAHYTEHDLKTSRMPNSRTNVSKKYQIASSFSWLSAFSASKQATRKTDKTVKCYCDWTLDIAIILELYWIHWALWDPCVLKDSWVVLLERPPGRLLYLGGWCTVHAVRSVCATFVVFLRSMFAHEFRSIQIILHVFKLKNLSSIFISRCSQFAKSAKSAKSSVKMRPWTDCLWIHDSAKS